MVNTSYLYLYQDVLDSILLLLLYMQFPTATPHIFGRIQPDRTLQRINSLTNWLKSDEDRHHCSAVLASKPNILDNISSIFCLSERINNSNDNNNNNNRHAGALRPARIVGLV